MKKVEWRYCETCGGPMPAIAKRPNHILHAVMSILTGGLWVIIWALMAFESLFHRPRCPKCKGKLK